MLFYMLFFASDESNFPDSQSELDKTLPVYKPYWVGNASAPAGAPGARATWINHATVVAEVDSAIVISDPLFGDVSSPVGFGGPKRFRDPACTVAELPANLSAVVISHDHRDHFDIDSCKALHRRFGAQLHWFVPDGVGKVLREEAGVDGDNVYDMVWWDERDLPGTQVKVVMGPANHDCQRGLFDAQKRLWGSWAVVGPTKRYYFAGDTGHGTHFKQMGDKYGPFDLSAIPIGAYEPR